MWLMQVAWTNLMQVTSVPESLCCMMIDKDFSWTWYQIVKSILHASFKSMSFSMALSPEKNTMEDSAVQQAAHLLSWTEYHKLSHDFVQANRSKAWCHFHTKPVSLASSCSISCKILYSQPSKTVFPIFGRCFVTQWVPWMQCSVWVKRGFSSVFRFDDEIS